MKRRTSLLAVIAGAVAGGAIALAVASGSSSSQSSTTTTVIQGSRNPIPASIATGPALSVNQIYRQTSPGVVDIQVVMNVDNGGGLGIPGFGQPQQPQGGEGAGVVYDTNGDILTDEHVVANTTSVKVKFQDGRRVSAKVLGTDPSTDIGVIHVNVPPSELHPIPFADSSGARVGDPVVAIGSPFSLPQTATAGIVSAVGRSIPAPNQYTIAGAIQTDAPINPGNSGGPLLDANGHVLGLVDQINTNSGSYQGVGFATPANTVQRIAGAIISGKPVKHSYVGVELNSNSDGGAQISGVQPGSPASSAGLHPRDLITAVNAKAIGSTEQFIATVDTYEPGQTVTLAVKRGGQTQSVKLKLGTRPSSTANNG